MALVLSPRRGAKMALLRGPEKGVPGVANLMLCSCTNNYYTYNTEHVL